MQIGPMEEVNEGDVPLDRYGLHEQDGDVRIWIRDGNEYRDGVVNINGLPKATLAGFGKLPFTGFLEKIFTRYGIEPTLAYFRMIHDLAMAKQKGIVHTVKTSLLLPLTIGSSVLGGFLPTWIAPSVGVSLQSTVASVLPFLNESTTYGFGVFISVLITTTWGHKLSDKLLTYIFKHIFDTTDTVLHFTDGELQKIINANQNLTEDLEGKLNNAIEFLQGEFANRENKYQDFTHRGDHRYIRRAAEKLRGGDFKTLLKFASEIRDKKLVSLRYTNPQENHETDEERRVEMFFSDQVLRDFSFKLRN